MKISELKNLLNIGFCSSKSGYYDFEAKYIHTYVDNYSLNPRIEAYTTDIRCGPDCPRSPCSITGDTAHYVNWKCYKLNKNIINGLIISGVKGEEKVAEFLKEWRRRK